VVQVTAGDAQVGVPELLLDEVHGKPLLRQLRRVDIHSLRHGFASALIERGAPVTEVQYLLGHSKPEVTLRVYSHWFKKTQTTTIADPARVVCEPPDTESPPAPVAGGSKMVAEAPGRQGLPCISARKISAPGAIRTHGPRIRNSDEDPEN
jgi:Phage integrase family